MKNKVLIIVENLPVPFDTRVWKQAQSLIEGGYRVAVLCPKGIRFTRAYEYLSGVHIYRYPAPPEASGALGYLWEYGWSLLWQTVFSWWIFLRRGFHVIQGCNPPDNIFLIALPFKLLGVKYIFDHHDVSPELYLSKYGKRGCFYRTLRWLERMTFRCADVVMSTNQSYRSIAIERGGVAPEAAFVVRNGPDLRTFKPTLPNPDRKRGKPFLVGYVGTMAAQEGLDILIDAAGYIRELGRNDVHFVCVGGGPQLESLRRMACEKDLDVEFTGRVPDAELLEILSTADVCVDPDPPSELNNISTMIKIMEYMALSKPIVQFDLKEGRRSAADASLYADPANMVPDFARKILWLLDHPEEQQRMGSAGRRRVENELAWNFSAENLLKAYQRALPSGVHGAIPTEALKKCAPE
jgi:glycosyltransferase involved in cell wall biosynthesis